MLCVETIGKIRRRRLVQGESISAIARDLRLARNTVKRALRVEGEAFEYRRTRQPQPKLGPYVATLDAWLEAEIFTLEPEPNLTVYFVHQPGLYQRRGLYAEQNQDYPDNAQRFMVEFTRMELAPTRGTSEPDLRRALGLADDAPLVADMKPPKVSSDVIYLDDEIRINVGSVGGLYLLKRSGEQPFSI